MVRDKISDVIDSIHAVLFSKKDLRQNQIFHLMEELAKSRNTNKSTPETESYQAVSHRLDEIWQYREWESMSAEQAFLYGQLYGCVELCKYMEKADLDQQWLEVLTSKYKDERRVLFQAIAETPGIQHKELSQKTGYRISRLSQIMNEKSMQELVDCCFSGREKYYFLRPKGKMLLAKMEEQDRKVPLDDWLPILETLRCKLERIPENANIGYVVSAMPVKTNNFVAGIEIKRAFAEGKKESPNINYANVFVEDNPAGGRIKCKEVKNSYQEMPGNHSLIG